jgi:PadR family transcriptional regulator, regulatory protein PadR
MARQWKAPPNGRLHLSIVRRRQIHGRLRALHYNAVDMENKSNRLLGGFESLLLLAILRQGENAYGVTIRQELLDRAGKEVAIGAIYTGLDRLEQKGFVESRFGDPTPERGGRAKRYYQVTASGLSALNETQRAVQSLLEGIDLTQKE